MVKVTVDINCNGDKTIKKLAKSKDIEVYQVKVENPSKASIKVIPGAVWDKTQWDDTLWDTEEGSIIFKEIKSLIGHNNIYDCIHLYNHYKSKNEYFITEDHHFLDLKEELESKLGIKILTPTELKQVISS